MKNQKMKSPSIFANVFSKEMNPYYRQANLERAGEYKRIPANKERVRKAGRVMVIVNTKYNHLPVRFTVRTKGDYVAAFKAAQFIKGPKTPTKKVVEVVEEPKLKLTLKRIRKVMKIAGEGHFQMVWKLTNNQNDVVKYFTNREKAREAVRFYKKYNVAPTTKPITIK